MFCVLSGGVKGKTKVKILVILSAFILTAVTAVVVSFCFTADKEEGSGYAFDLKETGGIGGFLSQFSLEYERQESVRELTLPESDDGFFEEYADFQSELGLKVLKFSGKRVEERYLKLKNKTQRGEAVYAVIYIYKEKVIAAHLTTLVQDSDLLPLTAFV